MGNRRDIIRITTVTEQAPLTCGARAGGRVGMSRTSHTCPRNRIKSNRLPCIIPPFLRFSVFCRCLRVLRYLLLNEGVRCGL
jgi:hypothetical protein